MSDFPARDLLLIDRYLDGALDDAEQAACRQRLESEAPLREALRQRQQLRAGFAAGRDRVFAAPAGFAAAVTAAARRLPVTVDDDGGAMRLCRRLLMVAAAVLLATLVWHSSLFRGKHSDGTIQAAPDEVQRVIEILDGRCKNAGEVRGK